MPALQVRDFPSELYEELREYSARNHRSIAQQTVACIESDIARAKASEAESAGSIAGGERDVPVPASVREASERARSVSPFSWLDAFGLEDARAQEERRAKRERLRARIGDLSARWNARATTGDEGSYGNASSTVSTCRDERADATIANVEKYLQARGGGR